MFRAYKKRPKAKILADTGVVCPSEACPNDPDLLLLRDAAADERNAIAFYLEAARGSCIPQLFLDVAEDEMGHYVDIMREISRLDPVQAEMFRDADLNVLVASRPAYVPKAKEEIVREAASSDLQITLPSRKDMPTVILLSRAISDELLAINKYQRYMQLAEDPAVQRLFCRIMNEEKEHVAQFTAALFELTHEPLPQDLV